MLDQLKRALRKLTPLEMASRELADAELESLTAQTATEYANSVVAYNTARIKRLRAFIATQTKEETT